MIHWVPLSDADVSNAHRIIGAFKEDDTIDALGFQRISACFDEWFYPAVTTPMTRARYYLIQGRSSGVAMFVEYAWVAGPMRSCSPVAASCRISRRKVVTMLDESSELAMLLTAIEFASHKHSTQRRKDDDASPYINHPIAVAHLLAEVGGVTDLVTLMAAVLHDTIEDTGTTGDELERQFGRTVRALVEEVTDDKSLDKAVRKQLQIEHAPRLSPRAKTIKLADKIANVRDVTNTPPETWDLPRRIEYLNWTEQVVAGCRGTNAGLEKRYDDMLRTGRARLTAGALAPRSAEDSEGRSR